jgi:protein-disulfide isomerase
MTESKDTSSKGILEKFAPILLVAIVAMSFAIGALWQRVKLLEKGQSGSPSVQAGSTTQQAQPTPVAKVTSDQIKGLFGKDIIKFGNANSKVLFVEIADPSCPYCSIASGENPELNAKADPNGRFKLTTDGGTYDAPVPEIKKLLDQGELSYAYIYMPGHGNGEMGMKALYCAYENDKFWQVHDLLMSDKGYEIMNGVDASGTATSGPVVKNDKSQSGTLANFLSSAMDPGQMKTCLDSGKYDSHLTSDTQLAASLGVQGTPGFFINDTSFPGAYSFKDMEPTLNAALGK